MIFSHVDSSVLFEQPGVLNLCTQVSSSHGLSRDRQVGDTWGNESMDICNGTGSVDVARHNESSGQPDANPDQTRTPDSEQELLARDAETQPPPMGSSTSALNISDICEGGAENLPPLPLSPESEVLDLPLSNSESNKPGLFRPFNVPNTGKLIQQTRSQSDNRGERGSHVSRAMERGTWRRASPSVERCDGDQSKWETK